MGLAFSEIYGIIMFMKNLLQLLVRKLAERVIKNKNIEIIGVTGSVGKSSTKEAIYSVLKDKFRERIIKSEGNLNNEIGLPLAILGFKKSTRFYEWPIVLIIAFFRSYFPQLNSLPKNSKMILEFAADKPGDIYYLTSFAKPRIAVISFIGEAHLEFFDSKDQIAIEKANLARVVPKENGAVILNVDNEYCSRIGLALQGRKKVIFYGTNDKAEVKAKDIIVNQDGTTFTLVYNGKVKSVRLNVIGKHQVYAALAAISVGLEYDIDLDIIIKSLETYKSLPGRDLIIKGVKSSLIIDSSYNANLTSMKAALETLRSLKTTGKKIAVLGDMREMGDISEEAHKEIGKLANDIADKIVTVGPMSKIIESNKWFKTSKEAADFLSDKIEENDIILVKGSHAIKLELVVDKLKEN